ncbi:hypothetical protein QYE73_04390 [Pseudomonas mosselii]|uniref:competence protein CoiA family protein n=1 Tax=Pseudomonas mosselii TaxID=78327 RepID=UPI00260808F3|nr:hypothetical protein [Pseudomonas mosselii]MDN4496502.1 hypothetical protein [Pseudomonas mosselii]
MEYAVNKLSNKLESAAQSSGIGLFICPCCKAMVIFRSGAKRKKHFGHWPGWGSPECENFIPSQYGQNSEGSVLATVIRRRMDLRLRITRGQRAAWWLELAVPACRVCDATVTIDVGGRLQHLDMRGLVKGARVTAELSVKNYRIVSYSDRADPTFMASMDRECPGLPSSGAAVFSASGREGTTGFPRAQELRGWETYAFLWSENTAPVFPDELVLDRFQSREGWSLALATIPEKPSEECMEWLRDFTGLLVNPPAPSITPIWPFLTRNSSLNAIECIQSPAVLLSTQMMPVGQQDKGPTMQVYGGGERLSATGIEKSPAFFVLATENTQDFRVTKADYPDIEKFISCTLSPHRNQKLPAVEIAFRDRELKQHVIPLHQKKCRPFVMAARAQTMTIEYLSMPPGCYGRLIADKSSKRSEILLFSGDTVPEHSQHKRLLPPEVQTLLIAHLVDPTCHVDINFGGFGRLHVAGDLSSRPINEAFATLGPPLRSRLLSFMVQLQPGGPIAAVSDDYALVRTFASLRPHPQLIPNYRTLVKDVLARGFELKQLGEGVSYELPI